MIVSNSKLDVATVALKLEIIPTIKFRVLVQDSFTLSHLCLVEFRSSIYPHEKGLVCKPVSVSLFLLENSINFLYP